ncbi:MAG: sigma-70 family RNA polymerase sigma factor [Planctomycetota bacterium]|nr:MAG: sigma-70 family RNA polymerase sigma factor [Planctomycetota bacterium]
MCLSIPPWTLIDNARLRRSTIVTRVQLAPLVSHLRRLASAPWVQERTDAELLAQFVTQRDETAFTALVARHGQVVQGVCRNILRNEQEVEDAVQATFLILARKAGTIQKAGSIASWLHGVAYRTAMNARKIDARRRRREKQSPARSPEQPVSEAAFREIQAILHEEVQRLPARCRAPFILCCLEGKSRTEAARQLGWKDRSVTARLTEAKGILRTRLTRRLGRPLCQRRFPRWSCFGSGHSGRSALCRRASASEFDFGHPLGRQCDEGNGRSAMEARPRLDDGAGCAGRRHWLCRTSSLADAAGRSQIGAR